MDGFEVADFCNRDHIREMLSRTPALVIHKLDLARAAGSEGPVSPGSSALPDQSCWSV
jgi:hypothetical protein